MSRISTGEHDNTKDTSDRTPAPPRFDNQSKEQQLETNTSSDANAQATSDVVVRTCTFQNDPLDPPYSLLSEPAKISIILTASFAAIISPISGSIYFPAIPTLSKDLHVSVSLITLTITTYLVSILPGWL